MPFFRISKQRGGQSLGTVEADDVTSAFDVFAMKSGFWDFQDLAQSMEMTIEKARQGLDVRQVSAPAFGSPALDPVPEFVIP